MRARRGDSRAAWCGIIATMAFTGWTLLANRGLLPDSLSVPFDLYYTGFIGNLVMFAIGYAAGHLLPRRAPLPAGASLAS